MIKEFNCTKLFFSSCYTYIRWTSQCYSIGSLKPRFHTMEKNTAMMIAVGWTQRPHDRCMYDLWSVVFGNLWSIIEKNREYGTDYRRVHEFCDRLVKYDCFIYLYCSEKFGSNTLTSQLQLTVTNIPDLMLGRLCNPGTGLLGNNCCQY